MPGPALALRGGKNDKRAGVRRSRSARRAEGRGAAEAAEGRRRRQAARQAWRRRVAAREDAGRAGRGARSRIVDERASPGAMLASPGAPLLQPTDERRRTGSHYTPRTLTEPIVRHALEPAFERLGPDATPEAGAGAEGLRPGHGLGRVPGRGLPATGGAAGEGLDAHGRRRGRAIPADEDEELHARRLVAQRCLYGVDKNPTAVDLAKLSLWLATLARDHEFTFLDHALKSGDSLVGLDAAQIAAMHWDTSKPGLPLFRKIRGGPGRRGDEGARRNPVRAGRHARARCWSRSTGRWKRASSMCACLGDAVHRGLLRRGQGEGAREARAPRSRAGRGDAGKRVGRAARPLPRVCATASIRCGRSIGRSSSRRCSPATSPGLRCDRRQSAVRRQEHDDRAAIGRTTRLAADPARGRAWQRRSRRAFLPPRLHACCGRAALRADRDQHDRPGRHARDRSRRDPATRRRDSRATAD